ncbi:MULTISPECIES: YciI family protein [unclassified Caulobacter]|uniref:YciI family protein n=1 Tax=unclassified Caulobacter TaxID=2648921 RepID=UPI0004A6B41B|nr:YciI family protein [Caulobacter sp. UNC358MFTsu5.1]
MLYMLLCYNNETEVLGWTKEQDDAVMGRLGVIHDRLLAEGKMGPSGRLNGTTSAKTLVKTEPAFVVDGPYAETKEQFLGFYTLDVADIDEALAIARELAVANPGGAYEVRPMRLYLPGAIAAA